MTLRMNGVGRTRNIMQREKERERERVHKAKRERKKAKTNNQSSLRTNTQTPFSVHQYHGPFAAMPSHLSFQSKRAEVRIKDTHLESDQRVLAYRS